MIPFGLAAKQFSQRLSQSLDGLSDASIESIRILLSQPINATVRSVEFQVFIDAENHGAPSIWMYFVGDNIRTSESSREALIN